jgi:hypothetical protein
MRDLKDIVLEKLKIQHDYIDFHTFYDAFVDYKRRNHKDLVLTDFLNNDEIPRVSMYITGKIKEYSPYSTYTKYEGSKIVKLYLNDRRHTISIGVNDTKLGIMDIYAIDTDEELHSIQLDYNQLSNNSVLVKIVDYMRNN